MTWFDQLQAGSFRGVPFLFAESDAELGRRTAVFEYPGRDLPFVEDLGRQARQWSLEIIVAGADYMVARDRLVQALEQPGAGTLIHPTLGQLQVVVLHVRGPRESTRQGGLARFRVHFIEAGENKYPAAATDGRSLLTYRADVADFALAQDFDDQLDVSGQGFIALDAIAQVQQFVDDLSAAIAAIPGLAASTQVYKLLDSLSGSLSTLIRTPIDLSIAVSTLFGDIVQIASSPAQATSALEDYIATLSDSSGWQSYTDNSVSAQAQKQIAGQTYKRQAKTGAAFKFFWNWTGTSNTVPLTTPSRVRQSANRTAIMGMVQVAAVIASARLASAVEYDSQDDADSARNEIAEQIDTAALSAEDQLFMALTDLRTGLIADLSNRPGLPRIRRFTPPVTMPALVLAHLLYGDAGRAEDIIARNRLRHPGFVPGGQTLEVLSD